MIKRLTESKEEDAIQVLQKQLKLSPRQAEVLHWMAEGKTNAEIGVILECSFFTVKNHTKEIFLRLDVNGRVAAAACAYRTHIAAQAVPKSSATKTRAVKRPPAK